MGAEVVDDPAALLAEDHRRVECPDAPLHPEAAGERDRLAAEAVDVGVVGNRERDVPATAREQHPTGRTDEQEGQRPPRPAPHLVHRAVADLAHVVARREPEAPLQLGMQAGEFVAERRLGRSTSRQCSRRRAGCRALCAAAVVPDGRPSCVARATAARATIAAFNETGLNARAQRRRSLAIAPAARAGIATIVATNGQRRFARHCRGHAHRHLGNAGQADQRARAVPPLSPSDRQKTCSEGSAMSSLGTRPW